MPAQELALGRNREGLRAGTGCKAGAEMGPRVKGGGEPVPTRLQERRNELATGRLAGGEREAPAAVSRGGAHSDPAFPPASKLGVRRRRWAASAR